ncbi:MAG TPA: CHAT domain-containing protein [Longimicrobiaceae bacterium]|nr:CHAT domain-containing protein [Longimicrobiaceae bacterium]
MRPASRNDTLALAFAARASDSASVQQSALARLAANDPRGLALDSAIASLRRAAELEASPASALADLAGALIVRAERTQAPRDLLEAYETAEGALHREPRNLAALYDRALALDRFGLEEAAGDAWRTYLAADPSSAWAGDARRRIAALHALPRPAPPPRLDAPPNDLARYALAEPQGARELGMDALLPAWGEAVATGDTARAAALLGRAATLGQALATRRGGDAGLADQVRAIRAAAGSRVRTEALARAHREYGAGRARLAAADFGGGLPHFIAAYDAAAGSPVLRAWAAMYGATGRVQTGNRMLGLNLLRQAVAAADTVRHPALAARARWSYGNTLAKAERYEQALETARASARLFARAGERENEGAALAVATDSRFVLGEPDSGYAEVHRALGRLRPYRSSVRLHSLLLSAARVAADDGLPRAAAAMEDEDVRVTTREGNAIYAAEARLQRAWQLAFLGDTARAKQDLEAARRLLGTIRVKEARAWAEGELHGAAAIASPGTDARKRALALDSAAAHFERIQLPFRWLPLLVSAAEARLAFGDEAGAAARLETVIHVLEQRRASIRIEPHRAAVFDAARTVVDRIVMLDLAHGRTAEALRHMDRARASLAPAGPAPSATDAALRTRPGEVAVEYALVADTLLAWTVSGDRVTVARTPVDTLGLARTINRLEARLQNRATEDEVRPALSELYDLLVRPVEARLGARETSMLVVADGVLAAVPFAALHDRRTRRYLIEDHPLRFAVSLAEANRPSRPAPTRPALFVADPAFDARQYPLDRLSHADDEVRAISTGYANADVLAGAAATRRAVLSQLPRSSIAHFAGHAVFDDARPERSYLLLAPEPGTDPADKLTAAELSRLDLHGVRLVVLSACRTVRSGRSRAAGFTGLAGALLAAGAHGVIGSTWDVDDRSTSLLMTSFHHAYQSTAHGPSALRKAQLALLRAPDSALHAPAAWAGFRYDE